MKTDDGGRSWKRDRSTDEVAGNLYAIKWTKAGPTPARERLHLAASLLQCSHTLQLH